jgi:hypothetical protein
MIPVTAIIFILWEWYLGPEKAMMPLDLFKERNLSLAAVVSPTIFTMHHQSRFRSLTTRARLIGHGSRLRIDDDPPHLPSHGLSSAIPYHSDRSGNQTFTADHDSDRTPHREWTIGSQDGTGETVLSYRTGFCCDWRVGLDLEVMSAIYETDGT